MAKWGWAFCYLFLFLPYSSFAAEVPHAHTSQGGEMEGHDQMSMPTSMEGSKSQAPLGIFETREGSGTSWLPDETPMYAIHYGLGAWSVMLHGNLFVQYIDEGGTRGDSQLGSINWFMAMARRPLWGGEIGLRAMFSVEPWTVGECGYPDLLATGEFCNGQPIHDHQHPHDLFMEMAGLYRRQINERLGFEVYGGPSAEPALGPPAFPHRVSAFPDPLAPITHHWFDATHISFGVFTAGLFGQQWKVEGSVFNGREPDENRLNFDLAPMDSFSGRIQFLPSSNWALQISAGHLNEAEQEIGTSDRINVDRYTASAIYHLPLPDNGIWATTFAFGRNVEEGQGTAAALLESSYNIANHHIFSGRAEWVEKSGHDLVLDQPGLEDDLFSVAKVSAGYTYQFSPWLGLTPGIGAIALVSFVPESLEATYGSRVPLGFVVFASLRPAPMEGMSMAPHQTFH